MLYERNNLMFLSSISLSFSLTNPSPSISAFRRSSWVTEYLLKSMRSLIICLSLSSTLPSFVTSTNASKSCIAASMSNWSTIPSGLKSRRPALLPAISAAISLLVWYMDNTIWSILSMSTWSSILSSVTLLLRYLFTTLLMLILSNRSLS